MSLSFFNVIRQEGDRSFVTLPGLGELSERCLACDVAGDLTTKVSLDSWLGQVPCPLVLLLEDFIFLGQNKISGVEKNDD